VASFDADKVREVWNVHGQLGMVVDKIRKEWSGLG